METETISRWTDFLQVADQTDVGAVGKNPYAFRGQSDSKWGLKPSLLRYLGDEITAEAALDIEKSALAEFKSNAHLHLPQSVFATTTDTISWWTVMQHHGAPTRLLDWTASLYVAAYFAVHGDRRTDGAIWIVHTASLHEKIDEGVVESKIPKTEAEIQPLFFEADPPPIVTFVGRNNKSDRMIAQQGFFSVCRSVLGDHGKIFEHAFSGPSDKLRYGKLVIPADLKPVFARRLRTMNISANALFPGIDGLAKSVAEFIQLASAPPVT